MYIRLHREQNEFKQSIMTASKMIVEIWSDLTCPFCYIAKRKFESALLQFKNAASIEIVWKSFEVAPGFITQPDNNMHQFLAGLKGISLEQSIEISKQVAEIAAQLGLMFNFHKAIPTNSFMAHQFSHFAKQHSLQHQAEERLYKAYFTEGSNIDDIAVLMRLGEEIGLSPSEVRNALESRQYADEVLQDIREGKQLGVTSVPHFVFDRKAKISGAQESNVLLGLLEKTFAEWKLENQHISRMVLDGQACKTSGDC
jgi:predicted DsbA family dithiol-disulfide isomerase